MPGAKDADGVTVPGRRHRARRPPGRRADDDSDGPGLRSVTPGPVAVTGSRRQ